MFPYCIQLMKSSKPSPFLKTVDSLKSVQARIYNSTDHLLPEEQWAQITIRLIGTDQNNEQLTQYGVFERRLADKLSYFDWKISLLADEEDYLFLHEK